MKGSLAVQFTEIAVGLASLALSASAVSLAVLGALMAISSNGARMQRQALAGVFALIGGLAAGPLVAVFLRQAYAIYLPLQLPMLMALPPCLLFYTREATKIAVDVPRSFSRRHLVVPLIGLGLVVAFWALPSEAQRVILVEGELPSGASRTYAAGLMLGAFILVVAGSLLSLGYLAVIVRRLRRYRACLKDLYSNIETRELRWLDWFIAAITLIWCLFAVSLVADNLFGIALLNAERMRAFAWCLLVFLAAWALRGAPATGDANNGETGSACGGADEPAAKYARSALSEEQAVRLAEKIRAAMADDALYLDPCLSLQKLSVKIGASPNLISQTLNETLGETFFDYVNRWRIEATKHRIVAGEETILDIALSAGFNTRSTFYKAFQRVTGSSPSAYRVERRAGSGAEACPHTLLTGRAQRG